MAIKVTVQPSHDVTIPYRAIIEGEPLTVGTRAHFNIPVRKTLINGKTYYDLEICGFWAETEQFDEIPQITEQLLAGLVNKNRLPNYVFIARRAGEVYPVYTIEDEVFVTTPGGPTFRDVELAKVRDDLTNYLHEVNILGVKGLSDKLHVRGIDAVTLGLRRPVFYLKKRIPGEPDFWAPVFATPDGLTIYMYSASMRHEVPVTDGQEILHLRELVAEALWMDRRLPNSFDLRPDRLFPEHWARLEKSLQANGSRIVNGLKVMLYRHADSWLGRVERLDEYRFSLYLGQDEEDVCGRVAQDFARRGLSVGHGP